MKIYLYLIFAFLSLFTALAFGASEPWGLLIFNGVCIFSGLYVLFRRKEFYFNDISKLVLSILGFMIFISCIQLFNQHNFLQKGSVLPFTLCRYYGLEGLSLLFSLTLFYFCLTQTAQRAKDIKILCFFIAGVGIIVSLIGITWQRGEYIGFFTGNYMLSSFGPFVSRNHGSQFVMASFFISLYLWLPRFVLDFKNRLSYRNICFFTISLILMIGVFFTHSRGGSIALFLGIFSLIGFYFILFIKGKPKKTIYLIFTVILFSGIIYSLIQHSEWLGMREFGSFSDKARLLLYGAAFDMLKDFPLTGVGFDAYSAAIDAYLKVSLKAFPRYLHNDWLELLLSFGYIYGSIIFAVIGWLIIKIVRLFKTLEPKKQLRLAIFCAGLIGFSFTALIDFPFHLPACALLFFCMLAFVSARTFNKEAKAVKVPIFIKILVVFISLGLLGANFQYFRTWRSFVFAKKLSVQRQAEQLEYNLHFYPTPQFVKRVLLANYKTSQDENLTPQEKQEIKIKTHKLAETFLKKYPKDKEISQFFVITK